MTVAENGEFVDLVPSAARLTQNFRDLGYEFTSAVADLVDNSISAGATQVDIQLEFLGPKSWLRIADNGSGMSSTVVSEAMRLGSNRLYGAADLGKFGLGLKTASLSQARCVTVASKVGGREPTSYRQLDLDHIIRSDRWQIRTSVDAAQAEIMSEALNSFSRGTVVLWERLDRILTFSDPWGGWAERHLLGLAEKLETHLAMVFTTFLARTEKRVSITLNGAVIEPWDPFVRGEANTEALPVVEVRIRDGLVRVSPFVLPAKPDFSSDTAWRRASGPRQWNRQQGFYIFRADRMIQAGGWSGMRTNDEHGKLARVGIEFWPDLDESFQINISKMKVRLPEELKDALRDPLKFVNARANSKYRTASRRASPKPQAPQPRTPSTSGQSLPLPARPSESPASPPTVGTETQLSTAAALTKSAADTGLEEPLLTLRTHMLSNYPAQAEQIGWRP